MVVTGLRSKSGMKASAVRLVGVDRNERLGSPGVGVRRGSLLKRSRLLESRLKRSVDVRK